MCCVDVGQTAERVFVGAASRRAHVLPQGFQAAADALKGLRPRLHVGLDDASREAELHQHPVAYGRGLAPVRLPARLARLARARRGGWQEPAGAPVRPAGQPLRLRRVHGVRGRRREARGPWRLARAAGRARGADGRPQPGALWRQGRGCPHGRARSQAAVVAAAHPEQSVPLPRLDGDRGSADRLHPGSAPQQHPPHRRAADGDVGVRLRGPPEPCARGALAEGGGRLVRGLGALPGLLRPPRAHEPVPRGSAIRLVPRSSASPVRHGHAPAELTGVRADVASERLLQRVVRCLPSVRHGGVLQAVSSAVDILGAVTTGAIQAARKELSMLLVIPCCALRGHPVRA
mmetsp:Transcript_67925/g.192784  ORF Transcript_67925/g.192784 Transcript_67925/m.192784 type:complete len:347 (+) Transcript_67925:993-2033(+)